MSFDPWTGRLDAYLDGELSVEDTRAMEEHLRECSACGAAMVARTQEKRAIRAVSQRYAPDPAFRTRIRESIAPRPARWKNFWAQGLAVAAMLIIVIGVSLIVVNRERANGRQLIGELADQHVATLASSNPVDVVSTDRHTVKPWFAGKIPFSFNLPELQGSSFVLVGGRIAYLRQSPGAELVFQVRQHRISVFIFQERAFGRARIADFNQGSIAFNVRSWTANGLDYFAISDVSGGDLNELVKLFEAAD
jgi:anti-sigma factor RsiW